MNILGTPLASPMFFNFFAIKAMDFSNVIDMEVLLYYN